MEENSSIRIRTNLNQDKFIKVNLEQTFDTLDILSLKLRQEDVYRNMCSDYGCIVGRVTTKDFGIPNAKISIFIPLLEEDENDQLITSIYPFKTTSDKNEQKIRYNLLPKYKQKIDHQPVGTFPIKREILDNDLVLEVYEKYYKFTTTTNSAGDYMIMGIPIGTHTVHMDIDFSDIGFVSSKPHELIAKGYPENLFESNSQFRKSTNLDDLAQIVTQNKSVEILPFWGDLEQCEVGITRTDFDIQSFEITPSAIFFGSIFSDHPEHNTIENINNEVFRLIDWNDQHCDIHPEPGDGIIEVISKTESGDIEKLESYIIEGNNWAVSIPMNKNRVITDEFGNLIQTLDKTKGVPTEIDVRFKISINNTDGKNRAKYLVPNMENNFDWNQNGEFFTLKWKRIYTVRQYIARYQGRRINNKPSYGDSSVVQWMGIHRINDCNWRLNFPFNRTSIYLTGIWNGVRQSLNSQNPGISDSTWESSPVAFPIEYRKGYEFYNNWINGSLYSFIFQITDSAYSNFGGNYGSGGSFIVDKSGFTENFSPGNNIVSLSTGVIKKIGDEYFYPSRDINNINNILFATNITDLGSSIENRDNFGIPNTPFVFDKISRTSYKLPINSDSKFFDGTQNINTPFLIKTGSHDLITRSCEIGNTIQIDSTSLLVTETIDIDLKKTLCNLNGGIYNSPTFDIDGATLISADSSNIVKRLFKGGDNGLFSFYFYFGMGFNNSLDLVKQKFFS